MVRVFVVCFALALAVLTLPFSCKQSASAGHDMMPAVGHDLLPARCFYVDDAGVTRGCAGGGMGPGDRDDGGGAPTPPPPDANPDARDIPFGQECLDNQQCASMICFFYRVKGQFCTQLCNVNADCPDASPGCGGMGVCRVGN
jgi:hypothetical protein